MTWLNTIKSLISPKIVYAEPTNLKTGKWVVSGEYVGIVTDLSSSHIVGVDIVDKDGTTLKHVKVPAVSVMLAKYIDIPESRRPITKDAATQLGYN